MTSAVLLLTLLSAPYNSEPDSVRLYNDLGNYHRAISTRVTSTQRYFDQGLRFAYGFNHEEAIRSFREAARRDPKCAICWWGVAYAYGPNINLPMDSASNAQAIEALKRAKSLVRHATPRERAFIQAVEQRYGTRAGPAGDSAYARAMQRIARQYPNDQDAQVLAAEAAMLLRPWNYWQKDATPYVGTTQLVARLERVLRANPRHPGACHFYIHAVEAAQPEKAVTCAERLASLMPGAGHIVHMPAHIYIRVGRWNDAIEANQHAVHADEKYLAAEKPSGVYPLAYYPHNHHFLSFAATMAGRSALALQHARHMRTYTPVEAAAQFHVLQPGVVFPQLTLVTFGRWDELLNEPDPPSDLKIASALAWYAKGVAHAAKGHADMAQQHLARIRNLAREIPESAGDLDKAVDIAEHALAGEIARRAQDWKDAETHFRAALAIEDAMLYVEPPVWHYPIRHSLGLVLSAQQRHAEAEKVYREDLRAFAENVWALQGLSAALHAQGKRTAAAAVDTRLSRAMKDADVTLPASRF